MSWNVVDLTQSLVRIPSVNPMGHPADQPEIQLEHRLTDYLQTRFEQLGVEFERVQVAPLRDNITAILPGTKEGIVVLEAHQDTVPIEGMTVEPFGAELSGGKVYGRGACDVKGGMATCLATLARFKHDPQGGHPTIVVACSVNEECGFTGAKQLAQYWKTGQSKLLDRLPDAVIVSEPTDLNVVVEHKGVIRWRCRTIGTAAHSSDPSRGDSAIYRMGQVLQAIESHSRQLQSRTPDAGLGLPSVSVGTIRGGISVNTVPDHCCIEIDRRLLPHESPEAAREELIRHIAQEVNAPDKIEHDPPYMHSPGLAMSEAGQTLAGQIIAAAGRLGVKSAVHQVAYGTDSPAFQEVGIPTVVFGPGSLLQAHTKDEWIDTDELERAVDILEMVCRNFE